jgi:hypothetical protein
MDKDTIGIDELENMGPGKDAPEVVECVREVSDEQSS